MNSDVVDMASMEAGIALTKWFKHEARRTYALLDETDEERDERRLAEWIARKGGAATVREIQRGCRWLRQAGMAEMALEALAKTGHGCWRDLPPAEHGGRPTRVFAVSTLLSTKPPETRVNSGFG